MKQTVKIGSGSGFSEDWVEPAEDIAKFADVDYLIFEALAERTIHEAHLRKMSGENPGYGLRFEERMRRCAIPCLKKGTKIITNDGSANPQAAARWLQAFLKENGVSARIAIVQGDDVFSYFKENREDIFKDELNQIFAGSDVYLPTDAKLVRENLESANCYLYYEPITEALAGGADIVICGRVADPSMFVAALAYEFEWAAGDWNKIAMGTVVGHLLECSGHSSGGYFTDCDKKTVSDLANIGFPIGEVTDATNEVIITKLEGSGGRVCKEGVLEQLHYEVHSFEAYVTPDVIAQFRDVRVEEVGKDRVRVTGFSGRERPANLKVLVGYHHGYNVAASIRYRGHNALRRAALVGQVWSEKLRRTHVNLMHSGFFYNDLPYEAAHREDPDPKYVEFRFSAVCREKADAERLALGFMGFYLNGPYGGGGIQTSVLRYDPLLPQIIDRREVTSSVSYLEA